MCSCMRMRQCASRVPRLRWFCFATCILDLHISIYPSTSGQGAGLSVHCEVESGEADSQITPPPVHIGSLGGSLQQITLSRHHHFLMRGFGTRPPLKMLKISVRNTLRAT